LSGSGHRRITTELQAAAASNISQQIVDESEVVAVLRKNLVGASGFSSVASGQM
jgi:hypothetical protein